MKTKKPPVIIIGMHRSGTTLLSKLLENAGIFMGNKKEINNEALFFLKFNEYIFKQASASWDSPINLKFTNNFFKENIKRIFKKKSKQSTHNQILRNQKIFKIQNVRAASNPMGLEGPSKHLYTRDLARAVPRRKSNSYI